ncbi:MAG: thioredoxin-dependent thiol peroxidase [Marinifilaceae bacterium]
MVTLKIGDKAPDFEGVTQENTSISLHDFKGKKVILYFYPKDNTPGCTAEACNLNANYEQLQADGYAVIGVSPDSVASHQKFIAKNALSFTLISDAEHKICDLYGVWDEKKLAGRTYMGVLRTTFMINEEGIIEKIITKVQTKNHYAQLMEA